MIVGPPSLVLDTYGGLGNRIKPVLSGSRFATATGRQFFYRWDRDRLFRALPTDLWLDLPARASRLEMRKASRGAIDLAFPRTVDDALDAPHIKISTHDPIEIPGQGGAWQKDLARLRPVHVVADRAVSAIDRLEQHAVRIGVMVRAHRRSSEATKATSPPEWFKGMLTMLRHEFPDAGYFLSCDNPQVQRQLEGEFSGLITTSKHGYNSREGVQDALVDLYALGCCDLLLGPDGSTFIHLAEYLARDGANTLTPSSGRVDEEIVRLFEEPPRRSPYPWR